MQITCPSCNYSKHIDPALLPPDTTRATCPKCDESFALLQTEQSEPAPVQPPAAPVTDAEFEPPPTSVMRPVNAAALPKAGFWIRVVATIVDGFIVFVIQLALGFLLGMVGMAVGTGEEVGSLIMLLGYLISFAYYIVFTGYCGQTPGKMALRIKVIRTDGSDIGYGKAAFREVLAKFIAGIILGIGYLMVAFDDQKQGLHDRMSDTYVIKL